MMGFDGTEVGPEITQLIQKHHLGTILLKAQNLRCEPLDMLVEYELIVEQLRSKPPVTRLQTERAGNWWTCASRSLS